MKNNEMWIIKSGRIFLPYTVQSTRKDCINVFCLDEFIKGGPFGWKEQQKLKKACVKIRVEEI